MTHFCDFYKVFLIKKEVDLLIPDVPSFVVLQVAFCPEAFATVLGAGERALIGVNQHVSF